MYPTNKSASTIWYDEKDNNFAASPPGFKGLHKINISETPNSLFIQLFPEGNLITETIRYAIQCGKHAFMVTVSEIKQFIAININDDLYKISIIQDVLIICTWSWLFTDCRYYVTREIWRNKKIYILWTMTIFKTIT